MYQFFAACTGWPAEDVHNDGGLVDLSNNKQEITRRTFLEKVGKSDMYRLALELGYDDDFKMRNDWHVSYFRSTWHDVRVYGFVHSAIEYVFVEEYPDGYEYGRDYTDDLDDYPGDHIMQAGDW